MDIANSNETTLELHTHEMVAPANVTSSTLHDDDGRFVQQRAHFEVTSWMHFSLATSTVLLIITTAIMGNVFVIAAIIREKNLKSVQNYLILSLSVADLMVASLVMPLALLDQISKNWFLGPELCDIWISLDVICCTSSILHLVCIALDRYWSVTRIDYMHSRTAKRVLIMIATSWTISLFISVPPLFGWKDNKKNTEVTGLCIISQDPLYTVYSTVSAFYVPLLLIIIIYLRIYNTAKSSIRKRHFQAYKDVAKTFKPRIATDLMSRHNVTSSAAPAATAAAATTTTRCESRGCQAHPNGTTSKSPLVPQTHSNSPNSSVSSHSPAAAAAAAGAHERNRMTIARARTASHSDSIEAATDTCTAMTSLTTADTCTAMTPLTTAETDDNDESLLATHESTRDIPDFRPRAADNCNESPKSPTSPTVAAVPPEAPAVAPAVAPSRGRKQELDKRHKIRMERERKAARTLAIITGTFVICWLPFFTWSLARPFCAHIFNIPDLLWHSFIWLGYLNSLLNPVIYTIFNPDFRAAFRKNCLCKR